MTESNGYHPRPPEAMLGSLDMTDERDRGLVRRKLIDHISKHKRWGGVTEDFKQDACKALKVALRWALEKQDHRAINGIVDTLKGLEGQNQSDEHLLIRGDDKADTGNPQGPVTIINIGTPEQKAALGVLARRYTLPHHHDNGNGSSSMG